MRVAHINYDAKISDFKARLETATTNFQSGIQTQTLKVANEAGIDVKKTLEVGEKALEIGNENRDALRLEREWTGSTLV